jgi:hypothetical protein
MWNVTLCRQLIFEDAIEAESEEEAVERNGYDDLNWRRNGPTQVVCVEPAYDPLTTRIEQLYDSQEWMDDEEDVEWALD